MSSSHRLLLLLLLFVLYSAGNFTALSQCSYLLQLKQSFNFTSFSSTKLATWKPNTSCCNSWEGVTCNPSSGRVTGLDLSNRSISGKISTSLFNLTSLKSLNLAYNLFDQIPFPNGFENLPNLTRLNLSNAGFIGQIPIGIAKLTKLEVLDLSTFYLNEVPSSSPVLENPNFETLIRNLSNLRELYLDGVNISSNGNEWSALVARWTPKLRSLSLVGCSITGPIDSSFSALRSLSIIRLDENKLNCSLPEFFGSFSSLSEVSLSACGMNGLFPMSVFLLQNLTVVDLSTNSLLSGTLPEFPDGSKLQSLKLPLTNFSGHIPHSVGKLKFLSTMDLSVCYFSGLIPSSIRNLTELVYLDLSQNRFTGAIPFVLPPSLSKLQLKQNLLNGSIPSSIGKLQHLREIDLQNNSLTGKIPVSLFSLPSLQSLQLNLNQLSGEIQEFPNGSSSQLGTLDLSSNLLQGGIPRSIFHLSVLKILNLASNNFSGTVEISWLSNLMNLSSLDLSYNHISIQDTDGYNLILFPNITTLMLVSCNLTRVPSFLRYLERVGSLDLSSNKILGAIPNWIWNIGNTSLSYLNLSHNMFTSIEALPSNSIMSPVQVTILDLHSNMLQGPILLPPIYTIVLDYSNNYFSSFIPSNITSYLNYTLFLSLSNNSLIGEIPPSICNATNLQVLDLSLNNLSGPIPPCLLVNSISLGVLNLGGNQLQGGIPQDISNQCALRTLKLNNNKLQGTLPTSLTNCNLLEVLDLGNNDIKDSFPHWLGKIHSLRVLVLRSNALYGFVGAPPVPDSSNYSFPKLQLFDISSNKFNGSIPIDCYKNLEAMMVNSVWNRPSVDFRYLQLKPYYYQDMVTITSKGVTMELVKTLTIFTSLDFSNNDFEGSIPEVIGELKSLIVLNFSHNALTGSIPPSFGNLRQLESLDLSSNHLSGEIPQELINLTFLSFLNLSYNNLAGNIPQGNQLSTFSNMSYKGNSDLCGSPLTKQCSNGEPNLCGSPLTKQCSNGEPKKRELQISKYSLVNWQYVLIGLGFGTGLAMLIGTLMVCEEGRKWYFEKVDTVLLSVVPLRFGHISDYCGDSRIGAEEMESDSMEREGWNDRRFCVFCTKLEVCGRRVVIHHMECDCSIEEER